MILDDLNIQKRNEENTKVQYITPIVSKQWKNSFLMEYQITDGKIEITSDNTTRRKKAKRTDYLLVENDFPLSVLEAKGIDHSAQEGKEQAIQYASMLGAPFAYSTNGKDLIEFDFLTGITRTDLKIEDLPSKEDLLKRYKEESGISTEKFDLLRVKKHRISSVSPKIPRYYQRIAIDTTLSKIYDGEKRLLLVMATGTGKTYTAFQICNILLEKNIVKKVLYLGDRNFLIDQSMMNDFKPLRERNRIVKVDHNKIEKQASSYDVLFSLFQQIKSSDMDSYKKLPKDFFDLIMVDECHRSSTQTSSYHEILQYFDSAIQIGLTATPKETEDVSNVSYFGEPIYTYSLKQGIEDGFLAPYRVIGVKLDIDDTGYIPMSENELDLNGNPLENRVYERKEFDKNIKIESRRQLVAEDITQIIRESGDPYIKTIVFCETQEHARDMVDRLRNLNSDLVKEDYRYVKEIIADSQEELENFIDPSSRYPVIAVTSELLSTGMDTKTVGRICLDKTISSMISYKQIVGRGTRVLDNFTLTDNNEEKSKMSFDIIDYRENYKKFNNPSFDGEPTNIITHIPGDLFIPRIPTKPSIKEENKNILEVSGNNVSIDSRKILYGNGGILTTDIKTNAFNCIKNNILLQFPTIEDFFAQFNSLDIKRDFLINLLTPELINVEDTLKAIEEEKGCIDLLDYVLYIGYGIEPQTKQEKFSKIKKSDIYNNLTEKQQEIIDILGEEYKRTTFDNFKDFSIFNLPNFKEKGYNPIRVKNIFSSKENYINLINNFEKILYEGEIQ